MVVGEEGPVFSWTAGSGFPLLLDLVEVLPRAGEGNKPDFGCVWSFSLHFYELPQNGTSFAAGKASS